MKSQLIRAYNTAPRDCSNTTATFFPSKRFFNPAAHCCSASLECFNTLSSAWPVATSYVEILCSLSAQSRPTHATISSAAMLFFLLSVVSIFTPQQLGFNRTHRKHHNPYSSLRESTSEYTSLFPASASLESLPLNFESSGA